MADSGSEGNDGLDTPSGVSATGQAPSSEPELTHPTVAVVKTGIVPTPLSGTIQSLQEAGVRGQSGMALLQVITGRLEADLDTAREEIKLLRVELREAQRQFHDAHERSSVLGERLASAERLRWVQAGALALGGVVGGVAVPHLNDVHAGLPIGGTLLATALLVIGCLPFRRGEEG